ncbi:hypothetical protein [Eisenbergiella sp.]
MSFKEQLQKDLDTVFLNLDEFAELHRIEGQEIPVLMDSDALAKLSKVGDNRTHGLIEADYILMGRAADLPAALEPGRLLNVDGREMIVISSSKSVGLVEIALRQNRNG